MSDKRVYLYDSTLRDGQQTQGVDFSAADKTAIAKALDELSIDYIEGGWPGANPTDDAFFANPPKLKNSKLTAFGMTRRAGRSASNDPGLASLAQNAPIVCMVGKSWDFQVTEALGIELKSAIIIGFSLALSSTAIVLKMLTERNEIHSGYGRVVLGILLLQDIAVIPILLMLSIFTQPERSVADMLLWTTIDALLLLLIIFVLGRWLLADCRELVHAAGP